MNDAQLDALIQSAIDSLADDSINTGAEALVEIAQVWASAGLPQSSFLDMRKYIIESAKLKTSGYFIDEKLRLSERKLKASRNVHH